MGKVQIGASLYIKLLYSDFSEKIHIRRVYGMTFTDLHLFKI